MTEQLRKTKRYNRQLVRRTQKAFAIIIPLLLLFVGFLLWRTFYFQSHFYPGTVINGIDCSRASIEEAAELFQEEISRYILTIKERGGGEEKLSAQVVGLVYMANEPLKALKEEQNQAHNWLKDRTVVKEYTIDQIVALDEDRLDAALNTLIALDPSQVTEPVDAQLAKDRSGKYEVIEEVEGNALKPDEFRERVSAALMCLDEEIDLEEENLYREPEIRVSQAMYDAADTLNTYLSAEITYTFGAEKEVVNRRTFEDWILVDEDYNVALSFEGLANYAYQTALKYDNFGEAIDFVTTTGVKLTLSGYYGWQIDQDAMILELKELIAAGETVTKEPPTSRQIGVYERTIRRTYVEIDLWNQHLYFYMEGRLMLETDIVSGCVEKGHTTPVGLFYIYHKERNAILRGEGYESPVKYWMPFNGGIGLHDASWRSAFGSHIYMYAGSHGCINLPEWAAYEIYSNVSEGTPVICYALSDHYGTLNEGWDD